MRVLCSCSWSVLCKECGVSGVGVCVCLCMLNENGHLVDCRRKLCMADRFTTCEHKEQRAAEQVLHEPQSRQVAFGE